MFGAMRKTFPFLITLIMFFIFSSMSGMEAGGGRAEAPGLELAADSAKEQRNLRFSMLGGPGYTPDYGVLLGGSALFTFSANVQDTALKRSVVPIAFAWMVKGGGMILVRPQFFFRQDRFRIFGELRLAYTLDNYYGVGYAVNKTRQRGPDSTLYRNIEYRFNPVFLFRFRETDLFVGASLDASLVNMRDPSEGVQADPDFLDQGGSSEGLSNTGAGIGINFSYDTRDIPANAYSGLYLDISAHYYSTVLGSSLDYGVFNLQYRQFRELRFLGPGRVLAWMVNGRYAGGEVPISDLSTFGSPFDLRGYYKGQFRDRKAIYGMAEYRHKFDFGDHSWLRQQASKLGFALWGGLGTIDPDFRTWSGTTPNFGAGVRFEVQPRMNFRIDVGRDPVTRQTLFYFNMTEAF